MFLCLFRWRRRQRRRHRVIEMVACDSSNDNDYDDDVDGKRRHRKTIQHTRASQRTLLLSHSLTCVSLCVFERKKIAYIVSRSHICSAWNSRKPTYASHHYTSLRELTDNGRNEPNLEKSKRCLTRCARAYFQNIVCWLYDRRAATTETHHHEICVYTLSLSFRFGSPGVFCSIVLRI